MKTNAKIIYKYKIPISGKYIDEFELELCRSNKLLSIQLQDGVPVMWVLEDTITNKEKVKFLIIGTGVPIDETVEINGKTHLKLLNVVDYEFIDTIQIDGCVWHIFKR